MKFIKQKWIYVFLLAIALTPLLWFIHHSGQLINGLDTNFPLNPVVWFERRLFVWNDSLNGGIDMNASVGGLFFHSLQYFPYVIGFSLGVTQKLTFIFWFGMTALSSFVFVYTFLTKKRALQLFFVLLYCFNIYLFNTWENVKVANLALVVGLPLTLSFIEMYRSHKTSALKLFCLQIIVALISAGSGINPAYFLALVFAVFLYFVVYLLKEDRVQLLQAVGITGIAFILGSVFWIVPLVDFLFFSSKVSTLESIGFTNWVASLSQNTSLVNVMRLLGAWDWYVKDNANTPIYIPYAVKYFSSSPFIFMSFVVPLLAFLGLIVKRSKMDIQRIYFLLLAIVGVFLGAGLHEPTGSLFSVFLNKVPFFSFFRSPWYIFTPYTIIGFGGLAILFLDSMHRRVNKHLYYFALVLLMTGYVLYSYPLWTGKVFRPYRDDSFYVTTPSYVFDFSHYISNSNHNRILTYPDDQLEQFKWGYKGTDSFLGLLVDKEVYAPSFNYPNKYIENYLSQFYLRLKKGNTHAAMKMLPAIGVDSLLLKSDANTLSPDVTSQFQNSSAVSFGPWSLIETGDTSRVEISENIFKGNLTPESLPFVLPYLPQKSVYVNQEDSQLEKLPKTISLLDIIESNPISSNQNQSYIFTVPHDGAYTLILENGLQEDKKTIVYLDDSRVDPDQEYDDAARYLVTLKEGKHMVSTAFPENITTLPHEYSTEVHLSQISQKQRITIPVNNFNPFVSYELSFEYKYEYGNIPQIELVQSYDKAPLKVDQVEIAKNRDWLTTRFVINPVPLSSKLELILKIVDSEESKISSAYIRNISVKRIVKNRLFIFNTAEPSNSSSHISLQKNNPTNYEASVTNVNNGYFLLFKENYQNGWNISSQDYIGGKPIHLQANGMYNLWFIPVGSSSLKITINFDPQRKYEIALFISMLAVLISVLLLLINVKRTYEKK